MRNLVLFMHTSLDGFVTDSSGGMSWISVDEEMFEYAGHQTDKSDTALYGRVTWQMMDDYWPDAGEKPNAGTHDKQHSAWYNQVEKIVISKTLHDIHKPNTRFISENVALEIKNLKRKKGNDIVVFGSPGLSHFLMAEDLIDEYWLFVNPVLLGKGTPLFKSVPKPVNLVLLESAFFTTGVIGLHYEKK